MLTLPSKYSQGQDLAAGPSAIIIKIENNSASPVDVWYFGTSEMELTDGHVYNLLDRNTFGLFNEIDWIRKTWESHSLEFNLSNLPYRLTSAGAEVRVSDELGDIKGADISVYHFNNDDSTALSDCLKFFEGKVYGPPSYNAKKITLRAVDNGYFVNMMLPNDSVADSFPSVPPDNENEFEPIVYGVHSLDEDQLLNTNAGGIRGIEVTGESPPKYLIAGHALNEITEIMLRPEAGAELYVHPASPIRDENSGGKAYVRWAEASPGTEGYNEYTKYSPNQRVDAGYTQYHYDHDISYPPENYANAYDDNYSTQAAINDNWFDDPGVSGGQIGTLQGIGCWALTEAQSAEIRAVLQNNPNSKLSIWTKNISKGSAVSSEPDAYFSVTFSIGYAFKGLTDRIVATGSYNMALEPGPDAWVDLGETGQVLDWADLAAFSDAELLPFFIRVFVSVSSYEGDSSLDNQELLKIGELRLVLTEYVPGLAPAPDPPGSDAGLWVGCYGREYGSWVDGISPTPGVEGNVIYNPAAVVTSLLIEEYGLSMSDILPDPTVYNELILTSVWMESRNRKSLNEWISEIMVQSRKMFFWSALGKARFVDLDTKPSADLTIPYRLIRNGAEGIDITQSEVVCNSLTYNYQYQPEHDIYRSKQTIQNADSIEKYGTFPLEVYWNFLRSYVAGASNLATHLIATSKGLWAYPHYKIAFYVQGDFAFGLETGDALSLSSDVDPHIKLEGNSWASYVFLIYKAHKYADGVYFEAIDLWDKPI